ncbi:MAG TPA: TolC family protein [Bdellovibrionales bacterium]|nr:TolC family protein [Bdellovibrionales bacterium]
MTFRQTVSLFMTVALLASLPAAEAQKTEAKKAARAQKRADPMPPDARAFLESLPEKKITLELVVSRGLESSDSFREVRASLESVDVPLLQARSPLGHWVYTGLTSDDNKNEQGNPQFPQSKTSGAFLGTRSLFATGTSLNLEVSQGNAELTSPLFNASYVESRASVRLSQSLWRDFFGYSTRLGVEAGELAARAARLGYREGVEEWTSGIIQIFYSAWLSQARAKAAQGSIERRQRLLDVTRIKLNRGTSERPDFLQIESAYLNSRSDFLSAEQSLGQIWRELVTSLKLPGHWVEIDPMIIPMMLDEPVAEASKLCAEKNKSTSNTATERMSLQAEASELSARRAKHNTSPELKLDFGYVVNGIDPNDRARTVEEVTGREHQEVAATLTLTVPLSNNAEEAAFAQARADRERAAAQSARAQADLGVAWLNACSDLKRLGETVENMTQAFEKQSSRVELEEGRFRLGRVPAFNVIQAGDDATLAELNLRNAQIQHRQAAWRIRRMAGQLKSYVEKLVPSVGATLK